jgi:hypothetical protein
MAILSKKPKLKVRKAIADIFQRAGMEANSLGHCLQTATQLRVAFFHMVSDFTTLKCCSRRIADPPPSYRLPPLQLIYFTTQLIRFLHGSGQLLKSRPEFNVDSHETPSGCARLLVDPLTFPHIPLMAGRVMLPHFR